MPKPASLQARATGAAVRRELDVRPYLPYARHVTDRIIALDTRALMLSFRLDGASFETADVRDLNDWHAKLNGAWRNIASDRLAVWHHIVRREDDRYPAGGFRSPFARDLDAAYRARVTAIFHKGQRVAAHPREGGRGKHTTDMAHMPEAHRAYAGWTIESMRREAEAIGPATALAVQLIFESKRHPLLGLRACQGVVSLARPFGRERLERACARALEIGARSYGSIRSILDHGLDQQPVSAAGEEAAPIRHANIRGSAYYH